MGLRVLGLLVGMIVTTVGCGRHVEFERSFDAESRKMAEAAMKPGLGEVRGEVFLRKRTGGVVTNAGDWVFLVPATPYSDEVFIRLFEADRYRDWFTGNRGEVDPTMFLLSHRQKADRRGRFSFEKLAPGRYYATAQVMWAQKESDILSYGGWVFDEVEVAGEEPVDIVLSGK